MHATTDDDHQLLAEYRATGSQAAFAQLVARHVDLVYTVARRRVGDAHLAEDVTQAVFLTLARKAASVGSDVVISGWLFNTARLVANNALKARQRQQRRESAVRDVAGASVTSASASSRDFDVVAPHLESAMDHLGRGERDAVLLRFYQGMSFKQVAGVIGISEDAAMQRVSRGVAKLRAYFAARGVNTSADALMMGLSAHAVAAAPVALKSSVAGSGAAAAGGATATATSATATTLSNGAIHAMAIANVKFAAVVVAALVLTGTAGVVSYNAISRAAPAPTAPPAAASRAPAAPAVAGSAPATATAPAGIGEIDPDMTALLNKKLPGLNFQHIATGDVIDFLRDVTGANIFVNQRAINALGGEPNKPITMMVRDVTLADVLRQILPQMVDKKNAGRVTFLASEGVIILTDAGDIPRLRAAQQWHANMPADDATRRVLDRALPEVNFRQNTFPDTIDFLRDVAGANIFVNWLVLDAAGVGRNRPIDLRVRNVPLRTVLWLLLESAQANPETPLDFIVDQKVITISTAADIAKGGKGPPPATKPATTRPAR